ncbi:GNAT family protein [Stigmatella sp. ncwal1]|uniref:GNAT family protein n=1 Tax=Stigmatella ashevillensis TaxID=2995309 RepID=A0ABT5DIA2_9BACT|nr:GNAT family protein [Stigmatella ashevillena]MDC0713384.1 GNAT family protein [Stigmatella ashevillena]
MSTTVELPRRALIPLVVPPVTLEGHGVRLEPLRPEHAGELASLCEDTVFEFTVQVLRTQADLERYIAGAMEAQARGTEQPFLIRKQETGEPLGTTRYMTISRHDRTLEIGHTWLARAAWRTPVNTGCKFLLLRHAFEVLQVMRVQLKTDQRNARSRAAIERIGAKFEGILRHHMLVRDGVVRDTAHYSILDTEWPEVKARLEERLGRG